MIKYTTYFLFFIIVSSSCTSGTQQKKEKDRVDNKAVLAQKSPKKSNGIEQLAVFSECSDYDNNLSSVASEVKFIQLEIKPPINDFMTFDVEISDEYIFLTGLTQISQYDRNGRYIKNIGSHGKGPKEFFRLTPPLQLDRKNKLIYAFDITYKKIVVYNFEGEFIRKISLNSESGCFEIIDSTVIALRQMFYERYRPDCKSIRFIDYSGKQLNAYPSHLYPLSKERFENYGTEESFLWKHNGTVYYLEYGADTVFQVIKNSLVPARVLTGKLKLDKDEFFRKDRGNNKLDISSYIMRPNGGVFESDKFIIFKLSSNKEVFYMVYNKSTMQFHRTFYKDASSTGKGSIKMNYFTDDLVSGLSFNPQYQSQGKAISLVSAIDIYNRKQVILDYIANHPSEEAEKLKLMVQNITEMDNPIVMIAKFK